MSNPPPGRNRLSKSPTRKNQANGKENPKSTGIPSPRGRYNTPSMSETPNGQSLSAKIVAPMPKVSPPLRSSRPRQPVSSATTSASRARAAERHQGPATRDGRRPSEQWLGKPYDPQGERTKRNIPKLGKIDFAERRARIQKAISQNLEESKSQEILRKTSQSTQASDTQAGAEAGAQNIVDQHQVEEMNRETDSMPGQWPTPGGLSVDTFNVPDQANREPEPDTANTVRTEFELDESPVLGRVPTQEANEPEDATTQPTLLTSATYQRPTRTHLPSPISLVQEAPKEEVQSPSVLDNVMQMRQRSHSHDSRSGMGYADESAPASAEDSPSDMEDRWGLGRATGLQSVQGSINIMLDDDTTMSDQSEQRWQPRDIHGRPAVVQGHQNMEDYVATQQAIRTVLDVNRYSDVTDRSWDELSHHPPRHPDRSLNASDVSRQLAIPYKKTQGDSSSLRAIPGSSMIEFEEYQNTNSKGTSMQASPPSPVLGPKGLSQPALRTRPPISSALGEDLASNSAINRALEQYESRGTLTPAMLEEMQKYSVDLQRASANEGSNGFMIQNLLDCIMDSQQDPHQPQERLKHHEEQGQDLLPSTSYEMPTVTPDTPPGWEYTEEGGTAVVYTDDASYEVSPDEDEGDKEDFHVNVRRANEIWEQQQRGERLYPGSEDDDAPPPPPKDIGYTQRSSTVPNSASLTPDLKALRISTTGTLDLPDIQSAGDKSPSSNPPPPIHAPPPPPPSGSSMRLPFGMGDPPQMPATYSERGSSEMSPRVRKNIWGPSGSSRQSIDSQRAPNSAQVPASVSMSSFTDATSVDADSATKRLSSEKTRGKTTSPGPEHKRLSKRRHIIKELLDTENSYHQDLKIIEDIYKATAVSDLISPEDKKVLFGNCDEIERFSLHFYDELRKAVASIYAPAKDKRWMNRRGSFSTTESAATGKTSMMTQDGVDEEKDRATTIGQAFLQNLQRMEQVYSAYLKNHDAANQRLSALRNTPTVKCWLDECHKNASDITSAWDLDSLLVKPTQRVAKYPMLLQQLLDSTPQDHPDREALSTAARDSISMLTRINEAKKRADLVDQIVNRKRKESDVRSGIAKAFGRRTEKLKERVGIAEAFQDPDYDELAHKFGGHFIRLQICMRDVQDYVNRVEKAVDQITCYAGALDLFTDVSMSSGSELESKWRKYSQAIRELTTIAFTEHKAAVNKRVIKPMIDCIKLHEGPQNAITKRKKRIVDYAKSKSIEKRGEKPDKKTVEASEMYAALNETLKTELPQLYSMTASLVQNCLHCFLEIQLTWWNTWERKLLPIMEIADIPGTIEQIEPAFRPDFDLVKDNLKRLAICNGATLADSANFLSPATTFEHDSGPASSKRPSTLDSSKRTMSVGNEGSPMPGSATYKRRSSSYVPGAETLQSPQNGRFRSNSALSNRETPAQTPGSAMPANRPWSNSNANTPKSSFTQSRPATANHPHTQPPAFVPPRLSAEQARSPRPASGATYFTARPEPDDNRFSGIFNSAMPSDTPDRTRPGTPQPAPDDMRALFVCASLFEFSIDKTRREGGYPYLTYVQGEVFDVVAQKGELWLAKNQDDSSNTLGWIWEQHFVILSQD